MVSGISQIVILVPSNISYINDDDVEYLSQGIMFRVRSKSVE